MSSWVEWTTAASPLTRAPIAQLLRDGRLSRPVRFARWPCSRCSGRSSAGTTSSRRSSRRSLTHAAHGFVIHGPAGVGKTRLADQCLALADHEGRNVSRATATEGARETPLGALAHLLPAGDRRRSCGSRRRGRRRAPGRPRPGQRRPPRPVRRRPPPARRNVGGARRPARRRRSRLPRRNRPDTRAGPAGLESLWHRARVRRIDLLDLDRPAIDTLLHLVLGGPVEATTIGRHLDGKRGQRPVRPRARARRARAAGTWSTSTACGA